jgi:imidazolonepropionase-like amidohydrolase
VGFAGQLVLLSKSFISFDTLLQWATFNGAMALGMEQELGSIEGNGKGGRTGI